ncbi:MAG: RNA methyltransferase [Ruminococcaceae bacterium]|nr:RNA methyltransferase [Oscillospiraceae bacterium]
MLDTKYTDRMKKLLGADFEKYIATFDDDRETALHLNAAKLSDIKDSLLPFDNEKIPYCRDGFYFKADKPGNHPLHHAGMFYIQEPSAMAPVSCLEDRLPEGIKILDACASPGGKSSQAANFAPEKNIVVSNEIVPSRCKTLVGNIERLGLKNSMVLNSDTEYLAKLFPGEFALVICDAPCSGEGMLRKSEQAREEWSEENVALCAERQREILDNLAVCVDEGGYLLYSTCTFSTQENEENVSYFLEKHPDFSLCEPGEKFDDVTTPGIAEYCNGFDPKNVRRFYPHVARGEGQFFALFKREGKLVPSTEFSFKDASRPLNKDERKAVDEFLSKSLEATPKCVRAFRENILVLPDRMAVPERHVFSCGVKLGEYKSGRIVPHHQFFSAYGKNFKVRVDLASDSPEMAKYLRGESFECDVTDGWAAILCDGIPLGGAKIVGGFLKNHYPKGLRLL